MKKKIIFFDIDGTLFNSAHFLNRFYQELTSKFSLSQNDTLNLNKLYNEVKIEHGYFDPVAYLIKILNKHQNIEKTQLEKIFYDVDLFEKSVYKDISVVGTLSQKATIGIFSQGDKSFQLRKIKLAIPFILEENIHIFTNKYEEADKVFANAANQEIYLIDDTLNLLTGIKKMFPSVITILIDRDNQYEDNKDIIKIRELKELFKII